MSSGGQNTTQTQSVPGWLQPYLTSNLNTGQNLLNTGQSGVANAPVAPLQPLQQSGMSSIGAVNPTSIGAADTSLANTLGGQYMGAGQSQMAAANPQIANEASGSLMNVNSNPYLSGMYNLGLQGIQNNVDSQFGAAGRNVLAGAPVQADQASTLANNLLGGQYATNLGATQNAQSLASGNYNTGVTQLNQAAAVAPGVTQGLYAPGQAQMAAGATGQTQAQNVLNAPYNTLSWYSSLLGQNASPFSAGSSSVTNVPASATTDVGLGIGAAGLGASIYGLMGAAAA